MGTVTIDDYLTAATAALPGLPSDHRPAELAARVALGDRQGWKCTWCGRALTPADIGAGRTNKDHVIPICRGGPDSDWNRALLHDSCNRSKGKKMTAGAWELAAEHGIDVTPPDTARIGNAIVTIHDGIRRLCNALDDLTAASERVPVGVWRKASEQMPFALRELHAAADVLAARAAGALAVLPEPEWIDGEPPF